MTWTVVALFDCDRHPLLLDHCVRGLLDHVDLGRHQHPFLLPQLPHLSVHRLHLGGHVQWGHKVY